MREHARRVTIFFDPTNDEPSHIQLQVSDQAFEAIRAVVSYAERDFQGRVTLDLAAAIDVAEWSGKRTSKTSPDYEVSKALYKCLVDGFFNLFWEDGVNGADRGEESY